MITMGNNYYVERDDLTQMAEMIRTSIRGPDGIGIHQDPGMEKEVRMLPDRLSTFISKEPVVPEPRGESKTVMQHSPTGLKITNTLSSASDKRKDEAKSHG